MRVEPFDFELPQRLIAQHPLAPRDAARLLVVGEALADRQVGDLPELLRPGDLLVFNDTRVLPARLRGRRGEATIEVTLLQPATAPSSGVWRALARPARKCHLGDRLQFGEDFAAEVIGRGEHGEIVLDFGCTESTLFEWLQRHGRMPLPPYIKRSSDGDLRDRANYQSLFARRDGAVAAPTASLHFTRGLMADLAERGLRHTFLTLHVGAGTFLPVRTEDTRDHRMHPERFEVDAVAARVINDARAAGGRIIAVGTTVLRTLETIADERGQVAPTRGETRLFITPGYRFKGADLLLTNFHLPRSTLFMLVAAFAGLERMQAAYAHAIERDYRFYSYGDACLLERGSA